MNAAVYRKDIPTRLVNKRHITNEYSSIYWFNLIEYLPLATIAIPHTYSRIFSPRLSVETSGLQRNHWKAPGVWIMPSYKVDPPM
jgi:hypothetical protein